MSANVLQLLEEGSWGELAEKWGYDPDNDSEHRLPITMEEWISTGWWHVVDGEGQVFFRHKEEQAVKDWLASNGYVVCADGVHYELQSVAATAEEK